MTRTSTVYPILKAELTRPGGARARFCAHPDKFGILVVIRSKCRVKPAWQWRHVMSPGQARVLYKKLLRDGWSRAVLD